MVASTHSLELLLESIIQIELSWKRAHGKQGRSGLALFLKTDSESSPLFASSQGMLDLRTIDTIGTGARRTSLRGQTLEDSLGCDAKARLPA